MKMVLNSSVVIGTQVSISDQLIKVKLQMQQHKIEGGGQENCW